MSGMDVPPPRDQRSVFGPADKVFDCWSPDLPGSHLRPDGQPCRYLGLPCNKCGAGANEPTPVTASGVPDRYDVVRVGVGIVVVDPRGQSMLVGTRQPGTHGAGQWALPGGKVEKGETPREAAARELCEECGFELAAEDLEVLPFWSYDRFEEWDREFVTLFFSWTMPHPYQRPMVMEPQKIGSWRWATPTLVKAMDTFAGLNGLLEWMGEREWS